jgi:hypothetical protein
MRGDVREVFRLTKAESEGVGGLRGLRLLELMKKDAQAFFRELCSNNVTASPFFDVPILASIDPDIFVSEVLALHPNAQASVFAVFRGRYIGGQLKANLQPEKAWLATVKKEFEKKMSSLRPMSKDRLKNQIGHSMDPLLLDEPAS